MINEQYKYSEITSKIIGSALEVHKILGAGFQEVIYQRALTKEMITKGLSFEREFEMQILYKNENVGSRRVDFFIEGVIMVEIKALAKLEDLHLTQGLNYLEAYNLEIGLLLNFGSKSLEYKRLINPKFKARS